MYISSCFLSKKAILSRPLNFSPLFAMDGFAILKHLVSIIADFSPLYVIDGFAISKHLF